jgi:hypothetical protein
MQHDSTHSVDSSRFLLDRSTARRLMANTLLRFCLTSLMAVLLAPGPTAQSAPAAKDAVLTVAGDVQHALALTAADLKSMTRKAITLGNPGQQNVYEGVPIDRILDRAGVPLGRELAGPALSTYVLAIAADGYQVLFSLGELDAGLSASDIIVADVMDGKALESEAGPFRIVLPHDRRGARSVRQLQRLEVVRLGK